MEKIREESARFQQQWNERARLPELKLDGEWPSIGVLDLISFELRGRRDLPPRERALLRGISCYLAERASEYWKLGGAEVSGAVRGDGVYLFASGGEFLPESDGSRPQLPSQQLRRLQSPVQEINVEAAFSNFLQNVGTEIEFCNDYRRITTFDDVILPTFALSIFTGCSFFCEGPWREEGITAPSPRLDAIVRKLGLESVTWYERNFPDEIYGQLGELYLQRLILPPALSDDEPPAVKSATAVYEFIKSHGISVRQFYPTALNFLRTSDEQFANTGFVLAVAIAESMHEIGSAGSIHPSSSTSIPNEVLAYVNAKGSSTGLLRPAVAEIRRLLSGKNQHRDYLTAEDYRTEDQKLFEYESACGLLPLIAMDGSVLREKSKQPLLSILLEALSHFDFSAANKIIEEIVELTPGIVEARIQRLYLELLQGDFDRSEHAIRALLTEPGMESNFRLYSYWGLLKDWQGDRVESLRLYQRARSLIRPNHPRASHVLNDYGWALFQAGRFDEALPMFDDAIKNSVFPVTPLLNRAHALRALGKVEESRRTLAKCLKMSPFDRRVFGSVYFGSPVDLPT